MLSTAEEEKEMRLFVRSGSVSECERLVCIHFDRISVLNK